MTIARPQSLPEPGASQIPRRRDVPLPQGRICLQPRDVDLLTDLHAYGCMLRGQIQELYFGSVPRANLRLRQLFDARYVVRAALPLPSEIGVPSGCQFAYLLGPAGIPVVAARRGTDPADIRRQQRHGTPAYLQHTIEIVNIRLAAEAAARSCPDVRLERFLPERLCQHAYQYREHEGGAHSGHAGWRREVYKPDAVMLLNQAGTAAGFAIEVDLGHTSSGEFLLKSRIHARYATSGLFARRYGVEKTRTLCVTTSAKRRDNLRRLLEKEGNAGFWFSTFAAIREEGLLGAVWYAPKNPTPARLLPMNTAALTPESDTHDTADAVKGVEG